MKSRTLKQLLLYNYRYLFGYSIVFGFILFFLGWQLSNIGPGLSQAETNVTARHLEFNAIKDMPVYPLHSILQWVSLHVLGVSTHSIRLPSVVIALLVAFCLYHLMKRWFGKSTALLSTAVFISADWFLFIARLSTGGIEFSLWLALALLCFIKLIENKNHWLLLYAITSSVFLFIPFGIYAVIALSASLLSYKAFRERIGESSLLVKIPSIGIAVVGLGLCAFFSWHNHEFFKNILGVQMLPSVTEYLRNVFINTSAVAVVFPNGNPNISPDGVFFVRFFELIFMLFGVIMLWRTRINRLNLVVLITATILALASGLSDGSRGGGLVLVPAAIFMTAGIRHLMHRWRRTFPKNPYARVAAFAPLSLLFVSVVALHYVSYFHVWPSRSATHLVFSRDLELAQKELRKREYQDKHCFVETSDGALQQLLEASNLPCKVRLSETEATVSLLRPDNPAIAAATQKHALVSEATNASVRWVVVQN